MSYSPRADTVATLYDALQVVRPLHRHVATAVAAELHGTGVTVGMRAVLEVLVHGGPQTVPEVARVLELPRQFVQRMTNDLMGLALVERSHNPAHRRSWLLAATDTGTAMLARIRAKEDRNLGDIAATLSLADAQACVRVLRAMDEYFARFDGPDGNDGPDGPDGPDGNDSPDSKDFEGEDFR